MICTGKILMGLVFMATLAGCKKDKPVIYPEENPLATFLKNSDADEVTERTDNEIWFESGLRFKSTVKGKIKAVTLKIPANATDRKVTVWDVSAKSVLRTVTIPKLVKGVEVKLAIDPLSIEPSKEYMISFNGNDFYIHQKSPVGDVSFPVTVGNIIFTGYNYGLAGSSPVYPVEPLASSIYGDAGFVFQRE